MSRFRVMTYNVHGCIGTDGRESVASVARVCADADPDLVALQELEAPETDDGEGTHHARDLAASLGMHLLFCRTLRRARGFYGHALLSRRPITLVKATTFPCSHGHDEARGAIWARVACEEGTVDVVSTHLGIRRHERRAQSRELLSDEWLGRPDLGRPFILCGDLNALPHARTYRRIAARFRDVQRAIPGHAPRPTFPSRWPFLRIDHVFVSPDVEVLAAHVPSDERARRASDHRPLVVDLDLWSSPAVTR